MIINLLLPQTDQMNNTYIDAINEMDAFLQKVFIPGKFIWEADLANGLDKDNYWYLWGFPRIEQTLLR